jgi:hypothetical protein
VPTPVGIAVGSSFETYCERLGNPDFISAYELAESILFCWKQPQRICVRDIVVMPTTSAPVSFAFFIALTLNFAYPLALLDEWWVRKNAIW